MAEGREQNIVSWNLRNFITIALMLALIWLALGFAGHVFVRGPAMRKAVTSAPVPVPENQPENSADAAE